MADKSTKTDDALLNGELDVSCPTTTNAATMTTGIASEAPPRPAQVNVAVTINTRGHAPPNRQDNTRTETPKQPSTPPPSLVMFLLSIVLQ